MSAIIVKQGDTGRTWTATLKLGGAAIDLTGATVTLHIRQTAPVVAGASVVVREVDIVSAAAGTVSYQPILADVETAGTFALEWHIEFADASRLVVPSDGTITLTIRESLDFSADPDAVTPETGARLYYRPEGSTAAVTASSVIDDFLSAADAGGARDVLEITSGAAGVYSVSDYGALGDGSTDDTAAINAAIAACWTAGGGTVYFPNGHYICSGPFDATTNSILTFPQDLTYGIGRTIRLVGESRGNLTHPDYDDYLSGALLDFRGHDTPSGTHPACVAVAPYVAIDGGYLTQYAAVDVGINDLAILVPSDPQIDGLQFNNASRANIGNRVLILAAAVAGVFTAPTANTAAIEMPGILNNPFLSIGSAHIGGWKYGVVPGEHTRFRGTYIGLCYSGIHFKRTSHSVSGDVTIEQTALFLDASGLATDTVVRLFLEGEPSQSGWNTTYTNGIAYDPSDHLRGIVEHAITVSGSDWDTDRGIGKIGGTRLELKDVSQWTDPLGGSDAAIARFHFATANDANGTYNLTNNGTATFAAGKIGNAVTLNGTTQYLTNTGLNRATGDSFTVIGWIKATSTAGVTIIAGQWGDAIAAVQQASWMVYNDAGTLKWAIGNTAGSTFFGTGPAWTTGTWYLVELSINQDSHFASLRVNNGTVSNLVFDNEIKTSAYPFTFGADYSALGAPRRFFAGSLDAWRFYDRRITDAERAAIYNAGAGMED